MVSTKKKRVNAIRCPPTPMDRKKHTRVKDKREQQQQQHRRSGQHRTLSPSSSRYRHLPSPPPGASTCVGLAPAQHAQFAGARNTHTIPSSILFVWSPTTTEPASGASLVTASSACRDYTPADPFSAVGSNGSHDTQRSPRKKLQDTSPPQSPQPPQPPLPPL